jgi:lipopolysaccharide/colanic/teichoic acid biosynthesis glycosyltransferase
MSMQKRAIDVVLAAMGLVAFSPIIIVIFIAIRLDTRGPCIFRQSRLGRGGKIFTLYKLRKFRHDLSDQGPHVTVKPDQRLTRVGKVLEKTKLDEFPQLWNILKGDMSFVGPRPETPHFLDCFVGEFQLVLDYVPGVFGPNQVRWRNEADAYPSSWDPEEFYRRVLFPAKAAVDVAYFQRATFSSDLVWVIRGLLVVVVGAFDRGTGGGATSLL